MSDDDEYVLDGAAGVAECSISAANRLIGSAQPGDGTALWAIAALDAALTALLAALLSADDKWDAYDKTTVENFKEQWAADPIEADYDRLNTKPLDGLLKAAQQRGKALDLKLIGDIRMVRHNLFHPKPVARSYPHTVLCDLVDHYLGLVQGVLDEVPDYALSWRKRSLEMAIFELRAAWVIYKSSGQLHA